MIEDRELLRRYAEDGSEAAFTELVRRHLGLVYAIALRQTASDAHRAQDIAQTVFTQVARKAGSLSRLPVLAGWLYRSTQFTASDVMRAERRRQAREQTAHTMNEILAENSSTADWDKLRPDLDRMLSELEAPDRDALVLRYFSDKPFREIGATLQITESAARMRVERALDKVRALLARRGLTSTSAALGMALTTQSGSAAPALVTAVAEAALTGASATGMTATALHFMTTAKTLTAVGVVIALSVVGLGVREMMIAKGETETELAAAPGSPTKASDVEIRVAKNQASPAKEFVPPRTEVAMADFRAKTETPRRAPDPNEESAKAPAPPLEAGMIPTALWSNVGRATPETAFQTELWAQDRQQLEIAAGAITFEPATREKLNALIASLPEKAKAEYDSPEKMAALLMTAGGDPTPFAGMRVLETTQLAADLVELNTRWQYTDGQVRENKWQFRHEADEWKCVLPADFVDKLIHLLRQEGHAKSKQASP